MVVDLTLLSHLSDDALVTEARRRGLTAEGQTRDALIAAIRGAAVPTPREAQTSVEPSFDPSASGNSPLRTARALFGRVVTIARTALERRETEPAPPPTGFDAPIHEPIRTRSMADLLISQGHAERGRDMLRALVRDKPSDAALAARLHEVDARLSEEALARDAKRALDEGVDAFVTLLTHGKARAVVWRLDALRTTRGRALLGGDGLPTLRVVRIVAHPDHSVESHRDDRALEGTSGFTRIEAEPDARLVVSIGLKHAERFVSMLHASL